MELKLLRKGDPPSLNARRLPVGRGLLLWPPFREDTASSKGLDDFVTWDESFSCYCSLLNGGKDIFKDANAGGQNVS